MVSKRILLKISGEVLGGKDGVGADGAALEVLGKQIKAILKDGLQVAIVLGGGNFWRYRDNSSLSIPRTASDALGMMAATMNARLFTEVLKAMGVEARCMAAHGNFYFADPYSPDLARSYLDKGEVVVCGGGTGNPYFTTDTTGALRALELKCEVMMKATKVDGIYDSDPVANPHAKFFETISYDEVLERELGVMDLSAVVLCKENKLPVRVFNINADNAILRAASGEPIGSLITP
ncbi:MAG: uridylate kinase [Oceanicoccus sp.]|jgi:uridylate kinase